VFGHLQPNEYGAFSSDDAIQFLEGLLRPGSTFDRPLAKPFSLALLRKYDVVNGTRFLESGRTLFLTFSAAAVSDLSPADGRELVQKIQALVHE
jgi:hypothetical protein